MIRSRWVFRAVARASLGAPGLFVVAPALAQVTAYGDRSVFLVATGSSMEPAWTNQGLIPGGAGAAYSTGRLTLSISPPSSQLYVGSGNLPGVGSDWTTFVAGNDIAISGLENLNVDFSEPMRAVGFDFGEPTFPTVVYAPCSALCPCLNSTFGVTLKRGGATGTVVGTIQFNRADNTAAFVGLASLRAFDRMEVRELGGSCDDEYFGQFWTRSGCDCPADVDGGLGTGLCDDGVTIDDLLYYLRIFEEGLLVADMDDGSGTGTLDGGVTIDDLLYYLFRFEGGC